MLSDCLMVEPASTESERITRMVEPDRSARPRVLSGMLSGRAGPWRRLRYRDRHRRPGGYRCESRTRNHIERRKGAREGAPRARRAGPGTRPIASRPSPADASSRCGAREQPLRRRAQRPYSALASSAAGVAPSGRGRRAGRGSGGPAGPTRARRTSHRSWILAVMEPVPITFGYAPDATPSPAAAVVAGGALCTVLAGLTVTRMRSAKIRPLYAGPARLTALHGAVPAAQIATFNRPP
jgi:hypothetical protein